MYTLKTVIIKHSLECNKDFPIKGNRKVEIRKDINKTFKTLEDIARFKKRYCRYIRFKRIEVDFNYVGIGFFK